MREDNLDSSFPEDELPLHELQVQRFTKLLESLAKEGISQRAAALRVNVPAQYVSDVKNGRRALTELFARRLAEEFGVDYQWLLGVRGSIGVSQSSISASSSDARKVWLPVFSHPVSGEPQALAIWDGVSVELAGAAAVKVLMADRPYVLRFGADDRHGLLKKNDLVLVSQAVNPAAELQVLKEGTKMFLARRDADERWETVSTTGTIRGHRVFVAGHCLGIVWRAL
jgi:plasmid maintenance system antidote protein VapI